MVDRNNNAFTLVEVLVTMIILMIVAVGTLPVLTKAKPRIENVTLRGQYACWIEDGKLNEQYMDERTVRSKHEDIDECKLKLDQRPARFYIVATGAGRNEAYAQVVTKYSPALANELDIILGLNTEGNNGITIVKTPGSVNTYEVEARSGYYNDKSHNNLIPDNIKSCRLYTAGENCPNESDFSSAEMKKQQTCEIVNVVNGDSSTLKIRVNQCDAFDINGNASQNNLINIEDVTLNNKQTDKSSANSEEYISGNTKMNFELYDSSYKSATSAKDSLTMSEVLDMIPVRRKSSLTQAISDLHPGEPGKEGAVLILW